MLWISLRVDQRIFLLWCCVYDGKHIITFIIEVKRLILLLPPWCAVILCLLPTSLVFTFLLFFLLVLHGFVLFDSLVRRHLDTDHSEQFTFIILDFGLQFFTPDMDIWSHECACLLTGWHCVWQLSRLADPSHTLLLVSMVNH